MAGFARWFLAGLARQLIGALARWLLAHLYKWQHAWLLCGQMQTSITHNKGSSKSTFGFTLGDGSSFQTPS